MDDLSCDGRLSIASANVASNQVSVEVGGKGNRLAGAKSARIGDRPRCLGVAELNGNGRLDIVTANSLSNDASVLLARGAPIYTGDCDRDNSVSVDELVRSFTIVLGDAPLATRAAADRGGDGRGTVDEVVVAVNAALAGAVLRVAAPPPGRHWHRVGGPLCRSPAPAKGREPHPRIEPGLSAEHPGRRRSTA